MPLRYVKIEAHSKGIALSNIKIYAICGIRAFDMEAGIYLDGEK
jgi:hypothetical protein